MNIFTFLIENKHFINNYIYDSFKEYLKENNIKENTLYCSCENEDKKQYLYNIIRDFIDFNFNIYKNKELQMHVKNETRYIIDYLKECYIIYDLPF